ncbi:MAG: pilus assembly protein PilB [Gammaproteobacteria bacterium]|nr:pilus assembly protein PilB [Gammaproteobacteria bacterium]
MSSSSPERDFLPWPQPPWIAHDHEINIHSGEVALVVFADGKRMNAKVADMDLQVGTITLRLDGDHKSLRIYEFERIKFVKLLKHRKWRKEQSLPDQHNRAIEVPKSPQNFQVSFSDRDRLDGRTLGMRVDHQNLYLFPIYKSEFFVPILIPHQAISGYQVGPLLGEMLVRNKHIDSGELDKAITDQADHKQRPIGEYLRKSAILTAKDLEEALNHQKKVPNIQLGELLVSQGLIDDEQLEDALVEQQKDRSLPLGKLLINKGLVTHEAVQQSLSKKLGIPYVDLKHYHPDISALKSLPESVVRNYQVLPLHIMPTKLVIAIEDPFSWETLQAVGVHTSLRVEPVMADPAVIEELINDIYLNNDEMGGLIPEMEDLDDEEPADEESEQLADNIVVKLVNKVIIDAHQAGASDIHIEPDRKGGKTTIRLRKDGVLVPHLTIPASLSKAMISRIKIMANLDISRRYKPQDGKINFGRFGRLPIDLRVATIPTFGSREDIVIRLLSSEKPLPLSEINLSEVDMGRLVEVTSHPHGLFFVCGPTGSGKTTTLHSILDYLNTKETKIWTAEDPIEISQQGLRQVQVDSRRGLGFAEVMRAFLRADPDIIMVGEMRDAETIRIGIEASLTGHLVFSTLHTNGAAESVIRLLDMGMDPFVFADALSGILAQRLTRRLCPECKQAYTPDDNVLEELLAEYSFESINEHNETTDEMVRNMHSELLERYSDDKGVLTLYHATGCKACDQTGYKGRIAIHELLIVDDQIRHAIVTQQHTGEIEQLAIKGGMHTLKQSGIEKVLAGLTDLIQVHRMCSK